MICALSVIDLSGNKDIYIVGSSANVICYSNFSILSIQWLLNHSNVSFFTKHTKENELQLSIGEVSAQYHSTIFTCMVLNMLPNNITRTTTIEFIILISEEGEVI